MTQMRGLKCDVCQWYQVWATGISIARVRRMVAVRDGWHSRNGVDICGACWDRGSRYGSL